MLTRCLEADGQIVHNSTGDADTLIVECALEYARQGTEVSVVADDTDVLVLLMYHWCQNMADVQGRVRQKHLPITLIKFIQN